MGQSTLGIHLAYLDICNSSEYFMIYTEQILLGIFSDKTTLRY